jgi:hypothetical protein
MNVTGQPFPRQFKVQSLTTPSIDPPSSHAPNFQQSFKAYFSPGNHAHTHLQITLRAPADDTSRDPAEVLLQKPLSGRVQNL